MDNRPYWVALQQAPGIGGRRAKLMLEQFGDIESLWHASAEQLRKSIDIPGKIVDDLIRYRVNTDVYKLYKEVISSGCWILTQEDRDYPELLKEIYDPPLVLYGKGNVKLLNTLAIGVVGTRNPSYYGTQMAKRLSADLVANNITIVSGMALGIDSSAHWGALNQQGATIAVLGCGVNYIYPKENIKLYEELLKQGAVISEYLPSLQPIPGNFPARNRIISGLSKGVVVVEAASKSGALITADMAIEQGRDVFAVPGLVSNPQAKGPHMLIKNGAKLVETVEDILEEYELDRLNIETFGKSKTELDLSIIEKGIMNTIEKQPVQFEEICAALDISSGELNKHLLQLELKGLIKQLPGRFICCTI